MKSREQQIFDLFEGVCPDCGQHAEPVSAGGTKVFQTMQTWATDITEFRSWEEDERANDVIGTINFECEASHKHTIDFGRWGEWL